MLTEYLDKLTEGSRLIFFFLNYAVCLNTVYRYTKHTQKKPIFLIIFLYWYYTAINNLLWYYTHNIILTVREMVWAYYIMIWLGKMFSSSFLKVFIIPPASYFPFLTPLKKQTIVFYSQIECYNILRLTTVCFGRLTTVCFGRSVRLLCITFQLTWVFTENEKPKRLIYFELDRLHNTCTNQHFALLVPYQMWDIIIKF